MDQTTPANIKEAFRRSGIYPVDRRQISDEVRTYTTTCTTTSTYGDNSYSNNKHILWETNQLKNYIRLHVIIKNGTYQQELVPPSINIDLASDVEPIRSCHACGGFLGQNPLVKRGLIPERLGDILIPPPMPPAPTRRPSIKIVTAGRVISGDEMLEILKVKLLKSHVLHKHVVNYSFFL